MKIFIHMDRNSYFCYFTGISFFLTFFSIPSLSLGLNSSKSLRLRLCFLGNSDEKWYQEWPWKTKLLGLLNKDSFADGP